MCFPEHRNRLLCCVSYHLSIKNIMVCVNRIVLNAIKEDNRILTCAFLRLKPTIILPTICFRLLPFTTHLWYCADSFHCYPSLSNKTDCAIICSARLFLHYITWPTSLDRFSFILLERGLGKYHATDEGSWKDPTGCSCGIKFRYAPREPELAFATHSKTVLNPER